MAYEKWSQYDIENIPWIDIHCDHPVRRLFIDHIIQNFPKGKILEIGGGKLIEAEYLLRQLPNLKYVAADVSDLFLDHCKKIKGLRCVEADMVDLPIKDKSFDVVHMSSVLEHSPDLTRTIKEIARVSRHFYLVMFKWRMQGSSLKSEKRVKPRRGTYFSTYFSLPLLLSKIREHGDIQGLEVCAKDTAQVIEFDDYKDNVIKNANTWRNGDRLVIKGEWFE